MTSVRIGIAGLGTIGKSHLGVLQNTASADAVAVADPSPEARDFARRYNVASYSGYREMIDREKLDGVIVAAPNAEHVPIGVACIERGIVPLIEKPIAETVEAAHRLCDAAEAKNVPVLVGHHRRYNAAAQRARKAIQDGLIGRPTIATVMYTWLKPDSYFNLEWRRKAGGGPILINLIHEIDLIRFVFGEIETVQAISSNAVRGFEVEDTAAVLLQFCSGALGTISLSDTAATPYSWDFVSGEFDLSRGTTETLKRQPANSHVFAGTKGSITLPGLDYFNYQGRSEPGWLSELAQQKLDAPFANPYRAQLEHFARVVSRQEPPLVSARDATRTLEATLAVKRAAESGQAIHI
jgi:predicted dehydrogenase